MNLTTPVLTGRYAFSIGPGTSILSLGSCFSEHVGGCLRAAHFSCTVNPFGVLFNPESMAQALERLLSGQMLEKEELFCHDGLYHSFLHHGSFSDTTPEKVLEKARKPFAEASCRLENLDVLMLTFGSAWVYELKDARRVVANCHKLPQDHFTRRLLEVDEIVGRYASLLSEMISRRPRLKVIFQVSPVRHIGDGLHESQVSKSVLHLSVTQLQKRFPGSAFYFPSYEIMMDELRDYRFYDEDMAHPSALARQIIWQRFQEALMDEETRRLVRETEQLERLLGHRLLHPSPSSINQHMDIIRQKADAIRRLCPLFDFSEEIESCLIRLQSSLKS